MKIKTEYDVGDECWIMYCNRPMKRKINMVDVKVNGVDTIVKYSVGPDETPLTVYPDKMFKTKEELIKSL